MRYAVYFSPKSESALYQFGARILGRTEIETTQQYDADAVLQESSLNSELVASITEPAAFYGFHATLKAPFTLKSDTTSLALDEALKHLASNMKSVSLEGLAPRIYQGFAALSFNNQPDSVAQLAAACVKELEPYRKPLTDVEINARIEGKSLSNEQHQMLLSYGYPYVLSCFDFHMTLSGRLDDSKSRYLFIDWVQKLYTDLVKSPPTLDQLTLWYQADRRLPFTQIAEYPLSTTTAC